MIKMLQRKFITTSMLIVTVLLVILLGIINVSNIVITQNNVDNRLNMIADAGAGERRFDNEAVHSEKPPKAIDRKGNKDRLIASNYFIVTLDDNNDVTEIDVSRTSQISSETAKKYALEAIAGGSDKGRKTRYRYQIKKLTGSDGCIVVFLDTSDETLSCLRVLGLSAAAGMVCWIFMLLLAMFLSKKAIRPIAENIENQRRFITDAGHEIKTPLAIIQANTDALELHIGENKWITNIQNQVVRMSGLTSNLLMLAKADEGADQAEPAEFLLDETVRNGLDNYSERIKQKGIQLSADLTEGLKINADENRIFQLVTILLDNAVKYCSEGGEIVIKLTRGGRATLTVENTCARLPDCEPEKLFERFYRDDRARTQKNGGYGIGLSIAKSIAEGNKGTIKCEYLGDNRIVFIVTL